MNAIAPPPLGAPTVERPAGELFHELADEVGTLVRQEIRLATKELTDKAEYAAKLSGLIIAGSVIAAGGLLALLATAILALGQIVALWVAALIVSVVAGVLACGLAWKGFNALKKLDPRPTQTILSIEETKLWAYEQVR